MTGVSRILVGLSLEAARSPAAMGGRVFP
jgi:hypothetical protein